MQDIINNEAECCACRRKNTPRDEAALRSLKNRISRIQGQLDGIGRMLDDNRYCGDILTQIAAAQSALQALGHIVLREHMESCVVEEIASGNTAVMAEALDLIKKLK